MITKEQYVELSSWLDTMEIRSLITEDPKFQHTELNSLRSLVTQDEYAVITYPPGEYSAKEAVLKLVQIGRDYLRESLQPNVLTLKRLTN
jgi:hypothetical protein